MNKTMEAHIRATEMVANLRLNLEDLNNFKIFLLNELLKTEKQIDKHENFIKILEEDLEL